MKQRDVIRYLHMGCGESLAARQFPQPGWVTEVVREQSGSRETASLPKRRKAHEEQR
ncbi:hypothetical protein [Thiolapillus sp.]